MEAPLPQTILQRATISLSNPGTPSPGEKDRLDLNALIREATAIAMAQWNSPHASNSVRVSMQLRDPAEISGNVEHLRTGLVDLLVHCVSLIWDAGELRIETKRDTAYQILSISGRCRSETASQAAFEALFAIDSAGISASPARPIIRHIVESHAGAVSMETDANGQPLITMLFPILEKCCRLHIEPECTTDGPTRDRILLVDDDETALEIYSQILRREGYELVTCKDSVEALEFLVCEQFDLLLTDDVMPGIAGPQLASAARAFDPSRPAILISGYASRFTPGTPPPEHVDSVLTKPVTPGELRSTVAQCLEGRPPRRPSS